MSGVREEDSGQNSMARPKHGTSRSAEISRGAFAAGPTIGKMTTLKKGRGGRIGAKKISYERSHYVYENKGHQDKMSCKMQVF